jgi:dGTP triphosphohydrolase
MTAVTEPDNRKLLGPLYQERLDAAETDGARRRVVIDLVASLTEESAVEVYRRATGVISGSVLVGPRV